MLKQLLLLFIIITIHFGLNAQSNPLNKTISVSITSASIDSVLRTVGNKASITFSYPSTLFDKNRTVSIVTQKATIKEILESLFQSYPISYSQVDDIIILYKDLSKPIEKEKTKTNVVKKSRTHLPHEKIVEVFDTSRVVIYEYLQDTVTILDTMKVSVTDTIQVFDTITNIKQNIEFIISSTFSRSFFNYSNYSGTNNELAKLQSEADNYKYTNNISISAGMLFNNWIIETGIGYTKQCNQYTTNAIHSWEDTENPFETITDSSWTTYIVDSYFYYLDGDTIWHNVLDSTISYNKKTAYPTHYDTLSIDRQNIFTFVSIPLAFGRSFQLNKKNTLTFRAGISANILIKVQAERITADNNYFYFTKTLQSDFPRILWEANVACSYQYWFTPHIACGISAFASKNLNGIYNPAIEYNKKSIAFHSGISLIFKL